MALTASLPSNRVRCVETVRVLYQEVEAKRKEVEETTGRSEMRGFKESGDDNVSMQLSSLLQDLTAAERRGSRCISQLAERCTRVENLRGALGRAREWMKVMKKKVARLKVSWIGMLELNEATFNLLFCHFFADP